MKKTIIMLQLSLLLFFNTSRAQNFSFDFNTTGQRVCLVESTVDVSIPNVTIHLLDNGDNTLTGTDIYRRKLYGTFANWRIVASNLSPGTKKCYFSISEGVQAFLLNRPGF